MISLLLNCLVLVTTLVQHGTPPVAPRHDTTLKAIEAAGMPTSFTADVAYRKDESLLGRSEIRMGSLAFDRPTKAPGVLGIVFETRIIGARREDHRKRIVFEKGWLIEIDEPRQLTIKRQLVHEGEAMDPMRLGGPFPLPVGQRREDVLRRFTVQDAPKPEHPMFKPVAGTPGLTGLRLVPRTGTPEADTWAMIDLWYDPITWLPVAVEARESNDDVRRIRLTNANRNMPLTPPQRGLLFSESPMDEWSVDLRPLPPRQPAPAPELEDAS